MIKAILFDLDGTLLNRKASVQAFIHNQYERHVHVFEGIEKDEYCKRFIDLDNNGYTWKDRVYQQLVNEYRLHLSADELLEDYISTFQNHCIAFEGMINVLHFLNQQGCLLGLISNGRTQFQLSNVRALGIEELFDTILISEELGVKKPDSEIYFQALNRLNVTPHEAVYIGDHLENDIEGAEKIGMRTIWKRNDQIGNEEIISITKLAQIPPILDMWTLHDNQNLLEKK
ncbi:HAD family hydrolase [Guptibacillus hwajinpoensis]|uniref:HAD family hydrolase n=1 Tax=Guptibacillus hwajinpoensis TaxID=208199 RepID=UPI003735873C